MKTFKTVVTFSFLTIFLLSLAWLGAAEGDTPTPTLAPTPTPAPVAGFSGNVTTGEAPLPVQFTDESTGSPDEWQWSWGDLTANDTAQSPVHVFNASGLYTITLTVTSPEGSNTTQKINYINVTAAPASTPTPTPTPTPTSSPTPTPTLTPTPTPTPTPKPTATKKPMATPRPTPRPSITPAPTQYVMPTIPPELLDEFNRSFATATPEPPAEPIPEPTVMPLPPQEPSPAPRPGRDHVPGILAFAGFNALAVALYLGASLLFARK